MDVIYKYEIVHGQITELKLRVSDRIVLVGEQDGKYYIWVLIDRTMDEYRHATFDFPIKDSIRRFVIRGTGHDIEDNLNHVGSFQSGPFVWHICEVIY